MDREGFRNRLKQYKQAREENPGLKYWEWKDIPKYAGGGKVGDEYHGNEVSTEENPIFYKEESAKDRYIRAVAELKAAGGWSDNLRTEIANEYSIPYLPEKEIRLTTGRYNTGKISTNLLDSIYNSAMRTGVPVDIALGLAGRESTLGIGRGFKKGQSINGTNLMSNWQQIDPDIPASKDRDRFNDIRAKILFHDNVSDDEYAFSADYIFDDINSRKRLKKMKENPIDNALKFYQSGKYNPGDKKHSQMVEEDARILMSDPAIRKWAKEKGIAFAEGTDGVRDNTYVAPIEKEQVFIPATGSTKLKQDVQRNLTRNGQIKSGAIDITSPEFDLLTLGRSIGNAIYKNLPTDMVYRRTTQSEIDDIIESGVFRKLPEGKVAGKGKTFTINGKTVTLHKKGGNAHGGKAFSKGEPWRGTTVTGTADETIVGIPGKGTQWKVGHHGDYSDYTPFENIEKGKGLWESFNENGIIENVSPKGMRVFRPFTYGYKEDGLLPITGLNLTGENVDHYADGGEVTGPPTYEQWDADMNQYNPTILDNASMYWSIEAAKKALHNEAMKLPGYAERWTEYYRSLPKNDPDINEFVDELWANENPNNVGLKNGKYYPHKSPEGGKMTIGPGFKLDSGSHGISTKTANRGMTKARLDQEARKIGKQHLKAVDQFINYGQTTNPADTVSPQIKMGLMDLRHQVGPLNEWSNLRQAVLNGDLEGIRKESTVTWNDNGKTKVDKRRKKIRDEKYFYYE